MFWTPDPWTSDFWASEFGISECLEARGTVLVFAMGLSVNWLDKGPSLSRSLTNTRYTVPGAHDFQNRPQLQPSVGSRSGQLSCSLVTRF